MVFNRLDAVVWGSMLQRTAEQEQPPYGHMSLGRAGVDQGRLLGCCWASDSTRTRGAGVLGLLRG